MSLGSEENREERGVDLGAQRGGAGLKVCGVKLDHAGIQRREASDTLATMHGCLREPFIGSKNDLILKRLGMSALTQIIGDINHD